MPIVAGMDRSADATPGEPPEASLHRPVLLTPLIQNLQPHVGQVAVDGTLGGGGVTAEMIAAQKVLADFPHLPVTRFATPEDYFRTAHAEAESAPSTGTPPRSPEPACASPARPVSG